MQVSPTNNNKLVSFGRRNFRRTEAESIRNYGYARIIVVGGVLQTSSNSKAKAKPKVKVKNNK